MFNSHLHNEQVFDGFIHGNLSKCEILNKVKLMLSYLGKTSKRNYIFTSNNASPTVSSN